MILNFTKMHGLGNDYIYINSLGRTFDNMPAIAKKLSDRHFSVGGDGAVFLCDSEVADVKMRMFNADGSEGKMCGNASRCIAKYLYDKGIVIKDVITLETPSGIKTLKLKSENGKVKEVSVDMGVPVFEPREIPAEKEFVKVVAGRKEYGFYAVSMGNPHAVTVVDEIKDLDIKSVAEILQKDKKLFPESVNVEFVKIINRSEIDMRVYERGSGETLACGTGASASVAALVKNGLLEKGETAVNLLGGKLKIFYGGENVIMTGGAEIAFEGSVEI